MNPPRPRSWNILFQLHAALLLISGLLLLASPTAHAIVDVNNNSVSDLWEKHYNNGQRFTNFDPLADPDGDGWTNAQEAAAGTNPFDANPPNGHLQPEIIYYAASYYTDPVTNLTETESPAIVTLNWPSLLGKQYTLLYSTDLSPGTWYPLGPPEIGTGEDMGNGITLTQQDGSMADRLFWRVAVTDPVPAIDTDGDSLIDYEEYLAGSDPVISDSDGDTLSDYAEIIAGTNPNDADEDGDGWTDPQEIAAGTNSNNQDTDGDGIPDSLDSQPLVSIQIFADTDEDGIPDPNDPDPNNPRGPKPLIFSENAPGNPPCELEVDETSNFILTVSNPAGVSSTSSDFTLYLNGNEEPANITALATPPNATGTQRFLLSWDAKVTTGYPAQTLQNLTLRFRDAQNATTWLNLARADVAEWEGMIAIARSRPPLDDLPMRFDSHFGGVKVPTRFYRPSVSTWYRGPRAIALYQGTATSPVQCPQIGEAMRYPLLFTHKTETGGLVGESILDISSAETYGERGIFFNSYAGTVEVTYDPGGSVNVSPGQTAYLKLPDDPQLPGTDAVYYDSEGKIYDRREIPSSSRSLRLFSIRSFSSTGDPQRASLNETSRLFAKVAASIRPYGAGSLEDPGLPLSSAFHTDSYLPALLPISQGAWHKLVLKAGPDAGALSDGIGLWLRKGEEGDAGPQGGFTLKAMGANQALTNLPVPADGKITLAADSPNWQQLTSPQGLTLFLQRDETVTDLHDLSLQLLKKHQSQTEEATRIGSMDVLPVDIAVDADRDGEITFDVADRPTAAVPYRFWINNDQDDVEEDEPISVDANNRDLLDATIKTKRDLEDFSRIRLKLGIPLDELQDGSWTVGLKFQDSGTQKPAMRIWPNESASGDDLYVSDGAAASRQISRQPFGETYNGAVFLPTSYWAGRSDTEAHLIFEGTQKGAGGLTLVLKQEGKSAMIEASPVHLNLLDVREMYRRARVPNEAEDIPHPWVNPNPPAQTWAWDDWNWRHSEDPDAEPVTAIFVHGWRLKYMDFMNWSDSSYKRLWHQGFKGKFYSFRWATFSGDNNGLPYGYDENIEGTAFPPGGTTYNASEYRAWLCGPALASFVNQLPNAGNRSLFAHSMGNVISGAALRSGMSIQRYAMCNAAMAAMAYDPDPILRNVNNIFIPGTLPELQDTPDTDPDPVIRTNYGLENKFNIPAMPEMYNFGLPDDTALGSWSANNLYFKPNIQYFYTENSILQPFPLVYQSTPLSSYRSVTALPEAMGYVTKSRTRAAGADLRTNGAITGGFTDMEDWFSDTHSAQWRWSNHSTRLFWEELFRKLELKEENP